MNSLRTEKLRAFIKSPDTAVLIKNEINVGYFSGFHHSEGVFLLRRHRNSQSAVK